MHQNFNNAIEEMQEKLRQLKAAHDAAHPGVTLQELLNSEETKRDMEDWFTCSDRVDTMSITELYVALRADYDAEAERDEPRFTNNMHACVQALIERQQLEKLREEYAADEAFLGEINTIAEHVALCMRVVDELGQVARLDGEVQS